MASDLGGQPTRRRYERVTGPFDGVLEEPVLVYDLNLGGCFINSSQQSPAGTISLLKIDLGEEGWITVKAETLHHLAHGFGVCFLDLDTDSSSRIARTVDALKRQRGF
jgi:hypothetical protein